MHNTRLFLILISFIFLTGCGKEEFPAISVDDMLNFKVITSDHIDPKINDGICVLNYVQLKEDESKPGNSYNLQIGGLIPGEILVVPVVITIKKDKLFFKGASSIGNLSDINITGTFSLDAHSTPHLAIDIKYVVENGIAGHQYIFDLSNNPFGILYYPGGTTEVNGEILDNYEALALSKDAINRDMAKTGSKIRVFFDTSGIMTVDTIGIDGTEWKPVNKIRYWLKSEERDHIIISLNEKQKAIFNYLWFGEPLESDYRVYFSGNPLNISILRNGDNAFFTINGGLQELLIADYINYKDKLGQWSKEEMQRLTVLKRLVYYDIRNNGIYSSIWSISASVGE